MVETLKPGRYIVIDPGHLDLDIPDCQPDEGRFMTHDGEKFFVFNTRYGAGIFPITVCGKDHGTVDSDYGTIAIMPEQLARSLGGEYLEFLLNKFHGYVVNEIEFDIYVIPQSKAGILRFGNAIQINTVVKSQLQMGENDRVERVLTTYLLAHIAFCG